MHIFFKHKNNMVSWMECKTTGSVGHVCVLFIKKKVSQLGRFAKLMLLIKYNHIYNLEVIRTYLSHGK